MVIELRDPQLPNTVPQRHTLSSHVHVPHTTYVCTILAHSLHTHTHIHTYTHADPIATGLINSIAIHKRTSKTCCIKLYTYTYTTHTPVHAPTYVHKNMDRQTHTQTHLHTYQSIQAFHISDSWTLFLELLAEAEKGQPDEASYERGSLTTSNLVPAV